MDSGAFVVQGKTNMSGDKSYFIDPEGSRAFNLSFTQLLGQLKDQVVSRYIGTDNQHRFRHDGGWVHPNAPQVIGGDMQRHGAEMSVAFEAIVANDLDLIPSNLDHLVGEMDRQFAQMMYATVAQACDRTGNTVDAQASGGLPQAFLAMLERIEFMATKEGVVDMPEIHVNPETAEKMMAALEASSPEFQAKVEALKARKIAEALDREAARKAKFVGYGADN